MRTRRNIGPAPTRRRHIARVAAALGFAAAALTGTLAACADAPTGPAAGPALSTTTTATTTTTTKVTTLLRDVPLASDLTKSWAVTKQAATLEWPEMGLKIDVPAGAVGRAGLTITARALKGDVVAYDFGPDGSKFAYPLTVMQSTKNTNFYKLAITTGVQGAYFKSAAQVDDATNTATVDAFQPTEVDLTNAQLKFKVTHFSGYLMSTGRSAE